MNTPHVHGLWELGRGPASRLTIVATGESFCRDDTESKQHAPHPTRFKCTGRTSQAKSSMQCCAPIAQDTPSGLDLRIQSKPKGLVPSCDLQLGNHHPCVALLPEKATLSTQTSTQTAWPNCSTNEIILAKLDSAKLPPHQHLNALQHLGTPRRGLPAICRTGTN